MRKLVFAFVVYVVVMVIVAVARPSLVYDHEHSRYRSFGVGAGDTLLPMWLLAVVVAALSYLSAGVLMALAGASGTLANGLRWSPSTPHTSEPTATVPDNTRQNEAEHRAQDDDDEKNASLLLPPIRRATIGGSQQEEQHHHPQCVAQHTHHPRCAAAFQRGGGREVDVRETRHADKRKRRNAVSASRVWARVMR